jgi:hypothetical protein
MQNSEIHIQTHVAVSVAAPCSVSAGGQSGSTAPKYRRFSAVPSIDDVSYVVSVHAELDRSVVVSSADALLAELAIGYVCGTRGPRELVLLECVLALALLAAGCGREPPPLVPALPPVLPPPVVPPAPVDELLLVPAVVAGPVVRMKLFPVRTESFHVTPLFMCWNDVLTPGSPVALSPMLSCSWNDVLT